MRRSSYKAIAYRRGRGSRHINDVLQRYCRARPWRVINRNGEGLVKGRFGEELIFATVRLLLPLLDLQDKFPKLETIASGAGKRDMRNEACCPTRKYGPITELPVA